ncbi:MAG: hypothetical protein OXG53_10435 [Chloroflexi bacterium]|nr:hypothetical protein [Chloroflexota bacterium]
MAATADIRFKRMQAKYEVLENAQDEVFDKVDSFEAALLGLTEAVVENQRQIAALHEKVDAIMKHLEVPYKPTGFVKE